MGNLRSFHLGQTPYLRENGNDRTEPNQALNAPAFPAKNMTPIPTSITMLSRERRSWTAREDQLLRDAVAKGLLMAISSC